MDSRTRHHLALTSLLVPLAIVAVKLGAEPISLYRNIDPSVYVDRSTQLAETWNLSGRRDPLGRYIPIAALFTLFGPSAQLASTYSAFMSYVAIPLTLYLLFRRVSGEWVALLTVAGFCLWRLVDIGTVPYNKGSWQYDNTIPFVYLAFYAAHAAITRSSSRTRLYWAGATGVCVGIAGINQYTLAAFTTVILTLTYSYNRRFRELIVTGGVGSMFALLILVFPGAAGRQPSHLTDRVIRDPTITAGEMIGELVHIITTPGLVLFILMGVYALVLYRIAESTPADSNIVMIAVATAGSVWVTIRLLNWAHIQWVAYIFGQYLLVGLCADLTLKVTRQWFPMYHQQVRDYTESHERLYIASIVGFSSILTAVLVSIVPTHLS